MISFDCSQCGTSCSVDELPRRGRVCFRCHLGGIRFGFTGGGGYGQTAFHESTNKEKIDEQLRDAAAAGTTIRPVGSRWV